MRQLRTKKVSSTSKVQRFQRYQQAEGSTAFGCAWRAPTTGWPPLIEIARLHEMIFALKQEREKLEAYSRHSQSFLAPIRMDLSQQPPPASSGLGPSRYQSRQHPDCCRTRYFDRFGVCEKRGTRQGVSNGLFLPTYSPIFDIDVNGYLGNPRFYGRGGSGSKILAAMGSKETQSSINRV